MDDVNVFGEQRPEYAQLDAYLYRIDADFVLTFLQEVPIKLGPDPRDRKFRYWELDELDYELRHNIEEEMEAIRDGELPENGEDGDG